MAQFEFMDIYLIGEVLYKLILEVILSIYNLSTTSPPYLRQALLRRLDYLFNSL